MDTGNDKIISGRIDLGKDGDAEVSYGRVTFTDNGCIDIYNNVTLSIRELVNRKVDFPVNSYEIKAIGGTGRDGSDSQNGEDGENGYDGTATEVHIKIGKIDGNIKFISEGGNGGNGGNGIDGSDGGSGGDAALNTDLKGGNGGDGSDGSGNGGNGGNGGKGPVIKVEYEEISDGALLSKCVISKGGEGGRGGKGGIGGKGGRNGDGITFAQNGKDGNSFHDGIPGKSGEEGMIIFRQIKKKE